MDLTREIMKRAARVGQLLAFLAVLFLAVNPHPLHAQPDDVPGHSQFGLFFEALDGDESSSEGKNGTQSFHGGCTDHFDPMVRAPVGRGAIYNAVAEAGPNVESIRQLILTSDPPPPRNPS